ncbi:unnamed protein product [Caenorhabditis bovis]|uniref:N-acetyltransferase domain-containing protein n=1 Tax=Caenorhabditis bovis TaxID=2654633 RepID=A0A8S1F4G3_9PELO|nr:unnamed protein product [Caenorhabditis bovis]
MWPTEDELPPIDAIIESMNPKFNLPYPMKSAINHGFPRNVGDAWVGAYTKNGYWFRLYWGGKDEWDEIVEEMWYRNEFMLDSNSFRMFESQSGPLQLLVAKNIRSEVIGAALLCKNGKITHIGAHFVMEEFRHVGIGGKMLAEIMRQFPEVSINAPFYLLPSALKLGMSPKMAREILKIRVENSSGFPELIETLPGVIVKNSSELDQIDFGKVSDFSKSVTSLDVNWNISYSNLSTKLICAFREGDCVGIAMQRNILNEKDTLPDLMISPLYAEDCQIAEVLLRNCLKDFYNPEEDFEFDEDPLAIYRRSVDFYILKENMEFSERLLKKLAGNDGKYSARRVYYQTCSNALLPSISHHRIFALGDPHAFLV